MPEMDGWDVAQRLRRQPGKRTAILMLSANPIDPHHMLEAERLYDDTLMKPIDLRQLLKKIHALLDIEWDYEAEAASPARPHAEPPRFHRAATSTIDRAWRNRAFHGILEN